MDIYEPAEDSELLAAAVAEHARGRVLDMGTGSGIQARAALLSKKTRSVTAADINPAAKKLLPKKVKFIRSDLFEKVVGTFDTIIFNPPYLPQDKGIEDVALYGGKHGYETIERFLEQVRTHLTKGGEILLLFSSLTNKEKVDSILRRFCYDSHLLLSREIGLFERLFVYRVTRNKLLTNLQAQGVRNLELLASGNRGLIYKGTYKRKAVCVKVKNPSSTAPRTISTEAAWMKKLNAHGIGPRYIKHTRTYVMYEYAEGEFLHKYLERTKKTAVLKDILQQCRVMDKLHVTKEEMLRPFTNVIVGKRVVLIDFERCKKTNNPKNVTQFVQFLISGHLYHILPTWKVDRAALIAAARKYKNDQNDKNFDAILKLIA